MGSIGMHSLEAIFDLEGDDFAFYPFVIANGDQRILDEVFGYMYRYHDGGIRRQWFSATDMWRNMCCCLYYSGKQSGLVTSECVDLSPHLFPTFVRHECFASSLESYEDNEDAGNRL